MPNMDSTIIASAIGWEIVFCGNRSIFTIVPVWSSFSQRFKCVLIITVIIINALYAPERERFIFIHLNPYHCTDFICIYYICIKMNVCVSVCLYDCDRRTYRLFDWAETFTRCVFRRGKNYSMFCRMFYKGFHRYIL